MFPTQVMPMVMTRMLLVCVQQHLVRRHETCFRHGIGMGGQSALPRWGQLLCAMQMMGRSPGTRCGPTSDLALAGGPSHRGTLLEAAASEAVKANQDAYERVLA